MSSRSPLCYISGSQAQTAASTVLTFKNWVPRRGPRGGRVVIDRFMIVADLSQVDVAAGGAWAGEDRYRALQRISVIEVDGFDRWGIRGDQTRILNYLIREPGRVLEYADIAAAAANANAPTGIVIPMRKFYAHRKTDFSMPADCFDRIEFMTMDTGTTGNGAGIGGGAITIDVATYYIEAYCHEEFAVELKARDQVKATLFNSLTENEVVIGGRLQELALHQAGADGGGTLDNLFGVRVEGVVPKERDYADQLTLQYMQERGAKNLASTQGSAVTIDPFINSKACPVLWGDEETRVTDGPLVDAMRVETRANTEASLVALTRAVKPRSRDLDEHVMRLYGLTPGDFAVKTKGKTKGDPLQWGNSDLGYMPMQAALR